MNITLNEFQTRLSITDISFENEGIEGWNDSNGIKQGETFQIVTSPYYIYLYKNDSVEIEFFLRCILYSNDTLIII